MSGIPKFHENIKLYLTLNTHCIHQLMQNKTSRAGLKITLPLDVDFTTPGYRYNNKQQFKGVDTYIEKTNANKDGLKKLQAFQPRTI